MDSEALIRCVDAFQEAANRHAIDTVLAMFAEEAEFEIVGLTKLTGKPQIRAIFEYDAGVNGDLQFINRTATGDTVTCQLVERNDRLAAIGIDPLFYPSCVFVFKAGRIQRFTAIPDADGIGKSRAAWKAFLPWVAEHYPVDHAGLFTPEGRFIQNRENGERVVVLLME